jgi:hypothetical protein
MKIGRSRGFRVPQLRALSIERPQYESNPAKLLFEIGLRENQSGRTAMRAVVRVGHEVPALQERGDFGGR